MLAYAPAKAFGLPLIEGRCATQLVFHFLKYTLESVSLKCPAPVISPELYAEN